MNGVGASRLYEISRFFVVSILYFFDGMSVDLPGRPSSAFHKDEHGHIERLKMGSARATIPTAVLAADPGQAGGRCVVFLSGNDADANSEIASNDVVAK